MVHIDNASGQTLYIPCNTEKGSGDYTLTLSSEEYGFIDNFNLTDEATGNAYFVFGFDASALQRGEYSYRLASGDIEYATGLLVVGDYEQGTVTYNCAETSYVVYDPETGESQVIGGPDLVEIDWTTDSNGDFVINTPEGYDGISKVSLTVSVPQTGGSTEIVDYNDIDASKAGEMFENPLGYIVDYKGNLYRYAGRTSNTIKYGHYIDMNNNKLIDQTLSISRGGMIMFSARFIYDMNQKQDRLTAGEGISIDNNVISVTGGSGEDCKVTPFAEMHKVADYLYEVTYGGVDYDFADEWFHRTAPEIEIPGGCTSLRNGNWYGRNLDWLYSNQVDFIVHTPNTLGVAGGMTGLTKDLVESGKYTDLYRVMPFFMQDAINRNGVFANINVVNREEEYGTTTYTTPLIEKREEICAIELVRYIVDHFATAQEACNHIRDYVSVYLPSSLAEQGFEVHFMIGDRNSTYAMEFINNSVEIIPLEQNVLSNFYLYATTANTDGSFYSIADAENPMTANGLTKYASGVERYNLAVSQLGRGMVVDTVMRNLFYTNTYTKTEGNGFWYSEYVGGTLGIGNTVADYQEDGRIDRLKAQYEARTRENPITWQTVHSAVYDLANGVVRVVPQEGNVTYNFALDNHYIKGEIKAADIPCTPYTSDRLDIENVDSAIQQLAQCADFDAEQIAGKQDTIADLDTIRSGAGAGSTAVQPETMAVALSGKVDNSTLDTVVSAVTVELGKKATTQALNDGLDSKQNVIPDLDTIKQGAGLGMSAVQPEAITDMATQTWINGKFVVLTRAEYEALETKNPGTIYFVKDTE